ncbi:asparagine synthase (glutamine-hydrolyzing) [Crocinitomix sp.]|nr:asparagine synthase (glutamine-hydrolyzing) [Crocinitomix sp.]
MCGIIGIWAKNKSGEEGLDLLESSLNSIKHRGPDFQSFKLYPKVGLGHTRLSILDLNPRSNQPFTSKDNRYSLVFNGEIYNYKTLKNELNFTQFETDSDTEVLFHLLIEKGEEALNLLDGFFAFAFYDSQEDTLLVARDSMGIKPLYYYEDDKQFIVASEMHSFFDFEINKELSNNGLNSFFGFTYIPAPYSALSHVNKLLPGYYMRIDTKGRSIVNFKNSVQSKGTISFDEAKTELRRLLEQSVSNRMIADVPLGSFLSGGLDSSIIAALAIKNNPNLKTFSIGFDAAYFDETNYANEVAQKIGSQHTVYHLTQKDFKENFNDFLDAIDEPFADSSAFAMYLLSKNTSQEVKVVLSGDGADELFGGYRKHQAEFSVRNMSSLKRRGIKFVANALKSYRSSRADRFGDINRRIQKMSSGMMMSPKDRYLFWCQFISAVDRKKLLKANFENLDIPNDDIAWKEEDAVLLADQSLVLPNDMLKKVDLMSMAHGLEVRTPFLDVKVVEFANQLPMNYKINGKEGKYILREAFKDLLPESVLKRSKKGFEIPLKEWLNDEIGAILKGPFFSEEYLDKQNLFNHEAIAELSEEWESDQFGDRIYLVWSLIVFQHWWNRYYSSL